MLELGFEPRHQTPQPVPSTVVFMVERAPARQSDTDSNTGPAI